MSRAPIIALAAVAALFLATAAVCTVLLFDERGETDRLTSAKAAQDSAAADVAREREEADKSLADKRSQHSTLDAEHDLLTQCVEATKAYFKLPVGDSAESERLFKIMYDVCPRI
ncbi:hypothetical protein GCM10010492_28740 [Saccharothrix mutabilis subsp. mutabilis]|uniref:Uncharacterized protein n=1 Tax=Saccharothrix mutabilis subsp. mutabilis TaxID=66855 RepID=A0ABN0TRY9_9PSEU